MPPRLIPLAIPVILFLFLIKGIEKLINLLKDNPIITFFIFAFLTTISIFFYKMKKEKEKKRKDAEFQKMIEKKEADEKREKEIQEEREKREAVEKEQREAREKLESDKFNAIQVSNIDLMTGLEFEKYLKKLLVALKYDDVNLTKGSGDFGVDLIASKENDKIAIQAKRQTSKVSRRAISDAVAGMRHYNCNKAMVITNNYFTKDAIKFAASTNCELVSRDILANWMIAAGGR